MLQGHIEDVDICTGLATVLQGMLNPELETETDIRPAC